MAALGYVTGNGRGAIDRLLGVVAARLQAEGWALAGVLQSNTERGEGLPCDMDLRVLGRAETVRISQALGREAQGCRLDPDGLETAVALSGVALAAGPRLVIVNRFGKAEIEGRGFRTLIAEALGLGLPVLVGVRPQNLPGFLAFAGGLAESLPTDAAAVVAWCREQG